MVGRLQIQPVETIRPSADVQPEAGGEQVPMLGDTAPAPVDPLGERLFPAVPAQAALGQGSAVGGIGRQCGQTGSVTSGARQWLVSAPGEETALTN